jgi:hypothetical protein
MSEEDKTKKEGVLKTAIKKLPSSPKLPLMEPVQSEWIKFAMFLTKMSGYWVFLVVAVPEIKEIIALVIEYGYTFFA